MEQLYVVHRDGNVIAEGVALAEAVDQKLSYDCQMWQVELFEHDRLGRVWRLQTRRPGTPWVNTVVLSFEKDEAAREAEIYEAVRFACWPGQPNIATLEDWRRWQAEASQEG